MTDWQAIESALTAVVTERTGVTVVWSGNDGPTPPPPYVTLKLIAGPTKEGGDDLRSEYVPANPLGEEIEQTVSGQRRFTVSIQAHTPSNSMAQHAQGVLGPLQSAFGLPSVLKQLRDANVAVIDVGPIQDLDIVASAKWASRAAMDLFLRTTDSVTERTGYIETMTVTSTFENPAGETVIEETKTYGVGE